MEYRLITLDGTVALDDVSKTLTVGGADPLPTLNAVAQVETAGELNSRITASRIVLTGVFALAWRKKQDDRELYLTVQTIATTVVARVDPSRSDETRRFAAAINDVGANRAVGDSTRLATAAAPRTTAERLVVENERVAAMTTEQRAAHQRKMRNIGIAAVVVVAAVIGAIWIASRPGKFEMKGDLTLYGPSIAEIDNGTVNPDCSGTGGYSDIRLGAGVTVYNAKGAIVGTSTLTDSFWFDDFCFFGFKVVEVPESEGPYQYEISHRGRLTVTEDVAKGDGASATLGD